MNQVGLILREIQAALQIADHIQSGHPLSFASLKSLAIYQHEISTHNNLMLDLGTIKSCRICAERDGNSCCFDGAEEWYERRLLLMNLLLGVTLPLQREVHGGCWFLGQRGCKLIARFGQCVNYICQDCRIKIAQKDQSHLRLQAGKELLAGLEAETLIMKCLSGHNLG